jgi:7-cyano-7-deazaguanine synthase in queuosine biosynthesis
MRSCFVLWSAGIDSTYLILRLLEDGYQVNAAYVDIRNNHTKSCMEQSAIEKMCPIIRETFTNFDYHGTIYKAKNNSIGRSSLRYKQVPYFIHGLLLAPKTDYRALGYVKGDSAIKNLEAIRSIYNQYALLYNGDLPKLVFPLKDATKVEIYTFMQECYPNILKHCVWCEEPQGKNFSSCGECTPCRRREDELKNTTISLRKSA